LVREEKKCGEDGEDVQVTIFDIKTSTTYTTINLKRGLAHDKNKVKLLKRSDYLPYGHKTTFSGHFTRFLKQV
jgi:hypothetical protein